MKKSLCTAITVVLFTGTLITVQDTLGQRVEATNIVTTSEGTISEFGPQSIYIKNEPGFKPIRYISSETTNYVDEDGQPVAASSVKLGLPVTIYYTKVGDTLVASKILVKKLVAPSIPETTIITTTSAGTLSEFGPERFIIRSETSPEPISYSYGKTTTYVDEAGAPVSIQMVKSGLPVTVYYTKVGDTLIANKVIVKTAVVPAVPLIEKKTTTTTTTTE